MKKKNLEFQNFIDKGQALYDKYGDTIKSLADMTGITKKFSIKKERADNDSFLQHPEFRLARCARVSKTTNISTTR